MTSPSDPRVAGRRLAQARKARGVTQQDAALHLQVSRPTLIAIEKGDRAAKPEEIVSLAALYGVGVHEIVRERVDAMDFRPHLRSAAQRLAIEPAELEGAIREFQQLAEDYKELEDLAGDPLPRDYPPVVQLGSGIRPRVLAEAAADRERSRLGLGDEPTIRLREVLEEKVGLRVFYGRLPGRIAGMYAYDDHVGGCILVNGRHPPDRARCSLIHEYGHLIVDRFKPGIDYLEAQGRKPPNEVFAEAFAIAFLLPARDVRERFCRVVDRSGDFQVADLCFLADHYRVSVEATARRLEDLALIPGGTTDHLKNESGLKVREAQQALGLDIDPEAEQKLPPRYRLLAVRAFRAAKISEGQLAKFLRCERVEAREAVLRAEEASSWEDPEGRPHSRRVDIARSMLK